VSGFAYIGRNSIYNLDFTVVNSTGVTTSADSAPVAHFVNYTTGVEVFSRATTPQATTGVYRLTLSSVETTNPGLFYVRWAYTLSGIAQEWNTEIEVASTATSLYESLTSSWRSLIESVWWRFADLFDSDVGGPHLKMYAQSSFGRERMAQLLKIGMAKLNSNSQPYTTFALTADFPFTQWGGLVEQLTYIEMIKHLMRTYVEQPDAVGVQAARLDRRDYLNRWQTILTMELDDVKTAIDVFKISQMNLGHSAVLVAGGIYGEYAAFGRNPAQPRYVGFNGFSGLR